MAGGWVFIVVEVVIPEQLLSGGDVAEGIDPRAVFYFINLTVRVAGMIQIGAEALAIDHCLSILQTVEVGARRAIVQAVRFFRRDARPGIFYDPGAFANGRGGEYACRMNSGGTDNQSHTTNFARPRGWKEGQ